MSPPRKPTTYRLTPSPRRYLETPISCTFYSLQSCHHSSNPANNIFDFTRPQFLIPTIPLQIPHTTITSNVSTILLHNLSLPPRLLLLFKGIFRQATTWNICIQRTANPRFLQTSYFSPDSSLSPLFTAFYYF